MAGCTQNGAVGPIGPIGRPATCRRTYTSGAASRKNESLRLRSRFFEVLARFAGSWCGRGGIAPARGVRPVTQSPLCEAALAASLRFEW